MLYPLLISLPSLSLVLLQTRCSFCRFQSPFSFNIISSSVFDGRRKRILTRLVPNDDEKSPTRKHHHDQNEESTVSSSSSSSLSDDRAINTHYIFLVHGWLGDVKENLYLNQALESIVASSSSSSNEKASQDPSTYCYSSNSM